MLPFKDQLLEIRKLLNALKLNNKDNLFNILNVIENLIINEKDLDRYNQTTKNLLKAFYCQLLTTYFSTNENNKAILNSIFKLLPEYKIELKELEYKNYEYETDKNEIIYWNIDSLCLK